MGATICFEAVKFKRLTIDDVTLDHIEKIWLPELQREWFFRKKVRGGRANFRRFDIRIEEIGKWFRGLVNGDGELPENWQVNGWITAIKYELEMKAKCYPRWIQSGKITKEDAVNAWRTFCELLYFFGEYNGVYQANV